MYHIYDVTKYGSLTNKELRDKTKRIRKFCHSIVKTKACEGKFNMYMILGVISWPDLDRWNRVGRPNEISKYFNK